MDPTKFLHFLLSLLLLRASSVFVHGGRVSYDWTVSFRRLAPLGVEKPVIVINDQFPGPLLNATTNDVISVNVHNNLTEPFLLTWHGVQQRRNPWQDGVQETNCPIPPGQNWTYEFQVKDQIGSFFYSPSLHLQRAAGGYGPIHINNRAVVPVPFPSPTGEFDILLSDWYDADHRELKQTLDAGGSLPEPDGILINGLPSLRTNFAVQAGGTYRLRISNVGLKASINFRIQDHVMQLIETEGSYTMKEYYETLDIHVGQSYSVLVTADRDCRSSYYMLAASRFTEREMMVVSTLSYGGAHGGSSGFLPPGPHFMDLDYSRDQAGTIRWDLEVGAARANPQGSFHYGQINETRTIILESGGTMIDGRRRYAVNNISFLHGDTPMLLADYLGNKSQLAGFLQVPDAPDGRAPVMAPAVVDVAYRSFVHFVFQNNEATLQSWHLDGYSVFVVGMGEGTWKESDRQSYNLFDAISRSTFQVYPSSWTAIMAAMDNHGLWNLRSEDSERRYLGQELYVRVKAEGEDGPGSIPERDMLPIPANAIHCGSGL